MHSSRVDPSCLGAAKCITLTVHVDVIYILHTYIYIHYITHVYTCNIYYIYICVHMCAWYISETCCTFLPLLWVSSDHLLRQNSGPGPVDLPLPSFFFWSFGNHGESGENMPAQGTRGKDRYRRPPLRVPARPCPLREGLEAPGTELCTWGKSPATWYR